MTDSSTVMMGEMHTPPGGKHVGTSRNRGARRAFTLIELLVVIGVIGLLVGIIAIAGTKIMGSQKRTLTRTIMGNVTMAIDHFANENPLRARYDQRNAKTFGPYPPYMLRDPNNSTINGTLEPVSMSPGNYLGGRFYRDFYDSNMGGDVTSYVSGNLQSQTPDQIHNDDIRALYTYLKVYTPSAVGEIPEKYIKPLVEDTSERSYVNKTGQGTNPGDPGAVDVLGIHDAWGVPLDYCLYVKLEYGVPPRGVEAGWYVADRMPVLRSRGIKREVYDNWVAGGALADEIPDTPEDWIFSVEFPSPILGQNSTGQVGLAGQLPANDVQYAGWARAVAEDHYYGYIPAQDEQGLP